MTLLERQIDHTYRVGKMILWFTAHAHLVVGKDWHRSAEEQNRIFIHYPTRTRCDGYTNVSAHQNDLAVDFVLFDADYQPVWTWPPEVAKAAHDYWEELGGKPIISWDVGHFESP